MSDKKVMVELECTTEKVKNRPFEKDHAQRILSKGKRGGWFLPEKSKWTYDKENGLTEKSNSGSTTKSS